MMQYHQFNATYDHNGERHVLAWRRSDKHLVMVKRDLLDGELANKDYVELIVRSFGYGVYPSLHELEATIIPLGETFISFNGGLLGPSIPCKLVKCFEEGAPDKSGYAIKIDDRFMRVTDQLDRGLMVIASSCDESELALVYAVQVTTAVVELPDPQNVPDTDKDELLPREVIYNTLYSTDKSHLLNDHSARLVANQMALRQKDSGSLATMVTDKPRFNSVHTKIAIVTSVRDEAMYLNDWVAYHKAIGVTDFLIYTNDNRDLTDEVIKKYADDPHVVFRDNNSPEGAPQARAFFDAITMGGAKTHLGLNNDDWIIVIDADEYLCVDDRCLQDYIGRMTSLYSVDAIAMAWKFIKPELLNRDTDLLIPPRFRNHRVLSHTYIGDGYRLVKSMFRLGVAIGCATPHTPLFHPDLRCPRFTLSDGRTHRYRFNPEGYDNNPIMSDSYTTVGCHVAHYDSKSPVEYLMKTMRTRAWIGDNFSRNEFDIHELTNNYWCTKLVDGVASPGWSMGTTSRVAAVDVSAYTWKDQALADQIRDNYIERATRAVEFAYDNVDKMCPKGRDLVRLAAEYLNIEASYQTLT